MVLCEIHFFFGVVLIVSNAAIAAILSALVRWSCGIGGDCVSPFSHTGTFAYCPVGPCANLPCFVCEPLPPMSARWSACSFPGCLV